MDDDILSALPARRGHFLLESGYHSELWLTLDDLFRDPVAVAPMVERLAERIRPHEVGTVCGPLLGGAFLAHALATTLGLQFCYTEPVLATAPAALFSTAYRLPRSAQNSIRGEKVAVVDDVMSAGSSVRATVAALADAGAVTVVVGSFLALGDAALSYFSERSVPVEALEQRSFELWNPSDCPHCRSGAPLVDPR